MTAAAWPEPPPGFEREVSDRTALFARDGALAPFRAAGLGEPEAWRRRLRGARAEGSGRGEVVREEIAGVGRVVLKALRRGGMLAPLRPDTFRDARRAIGNLALPDLARALGIPTPPAAALLLERAGRGRLRAFLAIAEIPRAVDLRARWGTGRAAPGEAACVVALVRAMHDVGLRHRDLNVGNLLLRDGDGGAPEAFVVDLDGAALDPGAVPFRVRVASLRRLERSYVKVFGARDPIGPNGRDRLWALYSGSDEALASRLRRVRWTGRIAVAWHRLGWRVFGSTTVRTGR